MPALGEFYWGAGGAAPVALTKPCTVVLLYMTGKLSSLGLYFSLTQTDIHWAWNSRLSVPPPQDSIPPSSRSAVMGEKSASSLSQGWDAAISLSGG